MERPEQQLDLFEDSVQGSPQSAQPGGRPSALATLVNQDFIGSSAAKMLEDSIDVAFAYPPQKPHSLPSGGVQYATQAYLEWTEIWVARVQRCLRRDGSLFLHLVDPPARPGFAWEIVQTIQQLFVLQNVIHVVRSLHLARRDLGRGSELARDVTIGDAHPVNEDHHLDGRHGYLFHFTHHGDVVLDRAAIGIETAQGGIQCRGDLWVLPTIPFQSMLDRQLVWPAYSMLLPERCYRLHGQVNIRRVLDPFAGAGTALIAAARLGVRSVGFEREVASWRLGVERLKRDGRPVRTLDAKAQDLSIK